MYHPLIANILCIKLHLNTDEEIKKIKIRVWKKIVLWFNQKGLCYEK